ncbi:glycosyltransferase family 25 protein [Denitratisoma oestradiolicum]|nr:glycosyltransferase family 25 protein [Denitratisoma oestradiolicum]
MTQTPAEATLQAFVINLPAASGRRQLMEAQLALPGLPACRIVPAVDGRALDAVTLARIYDAEAARRWERELTPGEIGCALSHLAVYERVVAENLPWALVLEDDALIGHKLPGLLEKLLPRLDPDKPEAILLSHVERYSAWGTERLDRLHRLARPHLAAGAHAYLITRAGAAALLAALQPVRIVPDAWRGFMDEGLLTVRCVVPYAVGTAPVANASQIGSERFSPPAIRGWRRWLRKYLYQKFWFQLVVKPLGRLKRQVSSW